MLPRRRALLLFLVLALSPCRGGRTRRPGSAAALRRLCAGAAALGHQRAAAAWAAGDGTVRVSPGESVEDALGRVPPGGELVLESGVHTGRLVCRRSVTIRGEGDAVLRWQTKAPYESAIDFDLSGTTGSAAPPSLVVEGVRIEHSSKSVAQNYAVYVNAPRSTATLRRCTVSSATGSGVGVEGGAAALEACTLRDCKAHGAAVLGRSASLALRDCRVLKCKGDGLLARDGAAVDVAADCVLQDNGAWGAELLDCVAATESAGLSDAALRSNAKGGISGGCDA